MSAQKIDGTKQAQIIREKIKARITELNQTMCLAVLLVGDDPASQTYVNIKEKACKEVGIRFERYEFEKSTTEDTLLKTIETLNNRMDVHGILVQLPLPSQNADRIIAAIHPKKDVDGFHPFNLAQLKKGLPSLVSAVALGIVKLIEVTGRPLKHARAALICSQLFATPIELLLQEQQVACTVISATDEHLKETTKNSDIVIVAVGNPHFMTGDFIKPGSIVIDVGTTKIDGKILGDVEPHSVSEVAGYLTPVPGGVGPMTVAMLLLNVLKAFYLQREP